MQLTNPEFDLQSPQADPSALAPIGAAGAPLRLAVIGCNIGRTRYHAALQAGARWKVAGIADTDPRYTHVWAREIGGKVPAYADIASLLSRSETFDALLVASPLAEREAHLQAALQTGKPVMSEFPFAPTLASVEALIQRAQTSSLLLPALPRRFDAYFEKAARYVRNGDLGTLQQIRCVWSFPVENVDETEDIVTGGWNALVQTLGSQMADACCWWLGDALTVSGDVDLRELRGERNPLGRLKAEGALANLIVTHAQGQSTHHLSRTRAIQSDERYLFSGTAGNLELVVSAGAAAASTTAPALRFQPLGQRFQSVRIDPLALAGKTPLSPAATRVHNLLLHFADCVQLGATPRVTAEDARRALEIVQAAYLSTQERTKISLPLRRAPDIARLLQPPTASSRPALPPE